MVKLAENMKQSDVGFWGICALVGAGFALVSAGVGAIIPESTLVALHQSRLSGGDMNSMRTRIVELELETASVRRENARLMTMYTIVDQGRNEMTRRIGSLEASLPTLLELRTGTVGIDSTITASILDDTTKTSQEALGGTVTVTTRPLAPSSSTQDNSALETLPVLGEKTAEVANAELDMLEQVSTDKLGIAMGPIVSLQDAYIAWTDIRAKVGALLLGFEPILVRNGNGFNLVAGPIDSVSQAEQLCGHISRVGMQCLPAPYAGLKLPQ